MSYNFEHFIPNSFGLIFAFMQLFLKICFSGMANNVDPDQTAPSGAVWFGSTLFAYAILSEAFVYKIFGHLQYQWFPLQNMMQL